MEKKKKKPLAEGILSSLASCQFCSSAHLSTVMSNRSVPGRQISTLSLSKWQFDSGLFKVPTTLKQTLKIRESNLENTGFHGIYKNGGMRSEVTSRCRQFLWWKWSGIKKKKKKLALCQSQNHNEIKPCVSVSHVNKQFKTTPDSSGDPEDDVHNATRCKQISLWQLSV